MSLYKPPSSIRETKMLPPPLPSTSKTSHKRTKDSSADDHCSKKSKMEAVKTAKLSPRKQAENGSARTNGKGPTAKSANCERNQSERLLPALNYTSEMKRLETQSLTMNPESLSKFMMLTEALNSYVCYAFAYEKQISKINSDKEFEKALAFSKKVSDQETVQQIQHPWKNHVLVICHRLQAVIHFKCYRKNEAGKLKLLLEELTKMPPPKRMVCDTGNRNLGPVNTMSPMMQQPTPSPAGSITLAGSSGSSGERAATISPNVIISSRTHSIMKSYMNYMTHLDESHNCWRRAVDIVEGDSDARQFFASVDEECGPINERSPILAISHYVLTSLSRLRKRRDTTGRR